MTYELTFCELREKEVVNVTDGKRLGRIIDMALTFSGHVCGIVVPGDKKLMKCVAGKESIFIPWSSICKIGDDVILVDLFGRAITDS